MALFTLNCSHRSETPFWNFRQFAATRINLITAGVLFILLLAPYMNSHAAGTLIFKSNFGSGTSVAEKNYVDTLTGTDSTTGFNWDTLNGGSYFREIRFQYVASQPYSDWVTSQIRQITGPYGNPIKALLMEVKEPDPSKYAISRNELQFRPQWGLNPSQFYTTFWMRLDDDYTTKWPDTAAWNDIWELKEPWDPNAGGSTSDNWRMSVVIQRSGNTPYWQLRMNHDQPTTYLEYSRDNFSVPVPIGRWFKVVVFYKYHPTDGRFYYSIDGNVVFDYKGRIGHPTNPRGVDFVSMFKNYRDRGWFAGGNTTYQYYAGLEIWTDFPSASSASAPSIPSGVSVTVVSN